MAEIKIKTPDGNNHVSLTTANASGDGTVTLPKGGVDLNGGSDGQFLKTNGSGTLSFASVASSPVTALNNATANELVTVGSTTTELDAESGLTFDGTHLSITDGDLKIATAGHGIDFSATADGSGTDTSELLADYEEGTFTPVFNAGTIGTVSNYGAQVGHYVRVGDILYYSMWVLGASNSGLENATGDLWVTGLPYNMFNNGTTTIFAWCYLSTANDSNYDCHYITTEYYSTNMYVYGRKGSNIQTNMGSDLIAQTGLNARGVTRLA